MTADRVEVEREWFVRVDVPDILSAAQVAALREAHLPYQALGLVSLREALAGALVVLVGPYWPPQVAADHRDRLRAVGLGAEVVGR